MPEPKELETAKINGVVVTYPEGKEGFWIKERGISDRLMGRKEVTPLELETREQEQKHVFDLEKLKAFLGK